MRARLRTGAAVAAISCAVGASTAQDAEARPQSAGRLVRLFDFNAREPTPLPITTWYRGQSAPKDNRERPGFPVWNGAFMDHDAPAFEGAGSVKLPIQGGSTSIMLREGVIPIFSSADYLVTAMVRTEGLTHAGAVLEAWQVDDQGREIDHSRVRSRVVRNAHDWTPIGVEILGLDSDAAFVQLELMVLQPRELAGPGAPPDAFRIWDEDYEGAAWFDSVAVHQLPRVELHTQAPGNLVRQPDRPELQTLVSDLAGEHLGVVMSVTDLHGREVDSHRTVMDSGRLIERWEPRLDRLGWYRGVIRLENAAGETVGGARCDFLWAGPPAAESNLMPGDPRPAFGVEFSDSPDALLDVLPRFIAAADLTSVTLPAWDLRRDASGQPERVERLAPIVDRLLTRGAEVTLTLDRVPRPLAKQNALDPHDPFAIFAVAPDRWRGYTEPFLDRFGQRVRHWQIGLAGDEPVVPRADVTIDTVRAELGRLVPGPIVTLPWRSDHQISAGSLARGTRLSLHLVGGEDQTAMRLLADEWIAVRNELASENPESGPRGPGLPELELTFSPLPDEPFGVAAGAAELVKRAVLALNAFGPAHLTLVDPVIYSGRTREPRAESAEPARVSPAPTLGVWAQLAERLRDRQVAGEMLGLDGVRGYMLEPAPGASESRTGALLAWRENASTDRTELRMYLGEGDVRAVDLFGNPGDVSRTPVGPTQQPMHTVELSDEPIYIENVDLALVRFQNAIRLDPGLIEARSVVHQHELVIDNPWNIPIHGKAYILEPGGYSVVGGDVDRGWLINPRVVPFTIPPRGEFRAPVSIELSAGTPAGTRPFVLDVELTADRDFGLVRVERTLELGLTGLTLEVYSRVGSPSSAADVFLEAEVTNRSDREMNLDLAAAVPGFPRGKATISGLKPGQTVRRTFPLPDGYDNAKGLQAAVSLTDAERGSGMRLVKTVTIE